MRPILMLPLVAGLVLAGCNSKPGVEAKNESAESVAKKVADSGLKPRPGRWQSTMKIEKMEMPGMPPQAQGALQQSLASAKTFTTCLTAEQVNKPNAEFFGSHGSGCTYQHFTMAGGTIDAEMTCNRAPMQMHMTMQGTYSTENYSIRVNNQGEIAPGKTMSTTMAVDSHRVGDCDGTEEGK